MFAIDPNSFYSRADLAGLLGAEGVDVDTFTARLRARKVFRQMWKGSDLLAAWETAPGLTDHGSGDGVDMPAARNRGNRRRRPGARVDNAPGAELRRYREELTAQEREGLAR